MSGHVGLAGDWMAGLEASGLHGSLGEESRCAVQRSVIFEKPATVRRDNWPDWGDRSLEQDQEKRTLLWLINILEAGGGMFI